MLSRSSLAVFSFGIFSVTVGHAQPVPPAPPAVELAPPAQPPPEPPAPLAPDAGSPPAEPASPPAPEEPAALAAPEELAKTPAAAPMADAAPPSEAPATTQPAQSQDLEAVVVTAQRHETWLTDVPGATHVIGGDEIAQRRALTTADILSSTPGVFATSSGSNDGIKIGIRGSGISNNQQYRTGIDFLFDGLSMPGLAQATPPALFEPYGLDYTEVLVGSNAFDYGSLALGGAINFVSKTGYDAERLQVRLDGGSYRYFKGQISTGRVIGATDYYLNITASRAAGYQDHTRSRSSRVMGNLGYKLSDTVTNRLYFRFAEVFFQTPGNLTRAQIDEDPRQGNPVTTGSNAYFHNPQNFWIGDKLTVQLARGSELNVGGTFNYAPLWINNRGVEGGTAGHFSESNATGTAQYVRDGELFGKPNVTRAGLRVSWVIDSSAYMKDRSVTTSPTWGQDIAHSQQDGTNHQVLSLSNDVNFVDRLWLRAGLSGIRTQTRNHLARARGTIDNTNDDYSQWDYNYILGLRYDIRAEAQVFANVSRSVEPVVAANNRHPSTSFLTKIVHQTGRTFELGGRARVGIFEGSLSVYRTDIEDELLSVEVAPGPPPVRQTINGSPTVHQGIEAGLSVTLLKLADDHRLTLVQTYTYGDLAFKGDAIWGENKLPGLPPHFYHAELAYENASGFNMGVNARYVSDYFVDYANSLSTDSYALLGARIGYEREHWEVHLEGTNLTDEHYAASARTQHDVGGADFATFLPGDGLGLYGGFSFYL